MFFSVGNKRNGTMDYWSLPDAISNLTRKGSGSREGAACKGVAKFYDPYVRTLYLLKFRPVQQIGGGRDVTILSPFWEATVRKKPLPETYLTNPLVKCDEFEASLPTM